MLLACAWTTLAWAQTGYKVVSLADGGVVTGKVTWSGPMPRLAGFPVTKDPQICDPEAKRTVDLERLIVDRDGGVANTVVFLKDVASGKAMDLPQPRRFLDQKRCRYEPHILLVAQNENLKMRSSDATLHTIHMDGAASFNLPYPFANQVVSRTMASPGLVNLKCNGGHVWMNATMFVVPHPYYAVTDESGKFRLTDVPPGTYEIVAWHEGWNLMRQEKAIDVLTEKSVQRPIFSEPRTWSKKVTVASSSAVDVDFAISNK
jgi:hypothetical protein